MKVHNNRFGFLAIAPIISFLLISFFTPFEVLAASLTQQQTNAAQAK